VIPAPLEGWDSDPFSLSGRNGYLYGRGVTDDKGPIIAIACAAAELLSRKALDLDLVFLIEGEEECGSAGFGDAVRKHKVRETQRITNFLEYELKKSVRRILSEILMRFWSGS
jgi:acetylornithine deacetylase/succinyl-diaminopimelate desuccinylase-like protein